MLDGVSQKILVSDGSSLATELSLIVQGLVEATADGPDAPLIYVKTHPNRTTAPHGLTTAEVKRIFGGVHCMLHRRRQLWFATLGDGLQQMPSGEARAVVDNFLKALVVKQGKHGLPQHWVLVWECGGGLHSHIVFIANKGIVDSLKVSSRFGQFLHIRWAYSPGSLPRYLSKERTSQAQYAIGPFIGGARKRGSHQLPGGGDRVRLSKALKADAIAARYVEDWAPTNAKRSEIRAPSRPYRLRLGKAPGLTPQQIPMFPELEKPPVRLRDFHGGTPTPAQIEELEFRRKRLGLSQRQVAALAGIKQPHYANVVRGHDSMSRFAARQLREALLHADALAVA